MTHEIVPARVYAGVFLTLLGLTVVTVAVSRVDLGPLNLLAAMTIAVLKAALVAWYFMHLRQATPLARLVAAAGVFWFAILLALTWSDYGSRAWLPEGLWW
jgi:cytochrome c oxidase subunit IV